MNIRLKNSPIIEVACEFKFEDISDDLTIYGEFHTKMGAQFQKKGQRTYQDIVIKQEKNRVEHTYKDYNLQQFKNESDNILIQIGQNVLIISKLKPYKTWEEFFPIIDKSFNNYIDITGLRKIKRIGLRYINKINFKEENITLNNYLQFRPEVNEKLGTISGHFITGAEFIRNNNQDQLRIALTDTTPTKGYKGAVLLDLDYCTIIVENLTIENALNWVKNAHNEIEEAFFSCITDKLKGILDK